MEDEIPEVEPSTATPASGGSALGRLQGLFGARAKPTSALSGGSALKIVIGGKAKLIIPGMIVLVILFGAIFFVISAVAVYASRLGSVPGYAGGCGTITCQGAFDKAKATKYGDKSAAWPSSLGSAREQINWTLSDEGKKYATDTLGIAAADIRHYNKKEVQDMIRAEVVTQFTNLSDKHGATVEMAQRALLTYQEHESSAFDLLDSSDRPSYTHDSSGDCTNILSLTNDKFDGFGKNKRVAASYDIHYAIYLGVQENMSMFVSSKPTGTGLDRWKQTIGYVFWPGRPERLWNSTAETAWNKTYANETPYACETTGGTGSVSGIGSSSLLEGTTDFVHENIKTTTFGEGDPKSDRPHHCADSGDNCQTAYGLYTGLDAPTPYYASLPARFPSCDKTMAKCPRIEVTNPATNKSIVLIVIELGPWNINDRNYVYGQARPQAESGTDVSGRTTNKAGLDVGPEVKKILGGEKYNWRFTTAPISGNIISASGDPCYTLSSGSGSMALQVAIAELASWPSQKNPKKYSEGRNEAWCADFASWVYKKAGFKVPVIPYPADIRSYFKKNMVWIDKPTASQIQPGDIILFGDASSDSGNHVGIAMSVSASQLVSIDGNVSHSVGKRTCSLSTESGKLVCHRISANLTVEGVGRPK